MWSDGATKKNQQQPRARMQRHQKCVCFKQVPFKCWGKHRIFASGKGQLALRFYNTIRSALDLLNFPSLCRAFIHTPHVLHRVLSIGVSLYFISHYCSTKLLPYIPATSHNARTMHRGRLAAWNKTTAVAMRECLINRLTSVLMLCTSCVY